MIAIVIIVEDLTNGMSQISNIHIKNLFINIQRVLNEAEPKTQA
jgi:hypothetical protein